MWYIILSRKVQKNVFRKNGPHDSPPLRPSLIVKDLNELNRSDSRIETWSLDSIQAKIGLALAKRAFTLPKKIGSTQAHHIAANVGSYYCLYYQSCIFLFINLLTGWKMSWVARLPKPSVLQI